MTTDLTGKLIIAPPVVRGTFWTKTVTLVTEHTSSGSIGIVLNKRSNITLRDFALDCDIELDIDGWVYVGGPVDAKVLSLVHSSEWECDHTFVVNDEISVSSSPYILDYLASGDMPESWRLFVGLTLWPANQLEIELAGQTPLNHNLSWLVSSSSIPLIFDNDGSEQWTQSIAYSVSEFTKDVM